MPVTHILTDTTQDISSVSATTTLVKPTGWVASHVFAAVFVTENAASTSTTITAAAGWTRIAVQIVASSSANRVVVDAFYALASVSALAFTNSNTGATYQQGVVVGTFNGVNLDNPIDVASIVGDTAAAPASTLTGSALIINTPGAVLCNATGCWLTSTLTATGFTVSVNAASNAQSTLLYNLTGKSPGTTGTTTINSSVSTNNFLAGIMWAWRPAVDVVQQGIPSQVNRQVAISRPVASGLFYDAGASDRFRAGWELLRGVRRLSPGFANKLRTNSERPEMGRHAANMARRAKRRSEICSAVS